MSMLLLILCTVVVQELLRNDLFSMLTLHYVGQLCLNLKLRRRP